MKKGLVFLWFGLTAHALAWIDTGHMVVAAIAEKNLRPSVLYKVERLLKIGGDPKSESFLTASCWADDHKTSENGPWHYINIHFRTDGKPVDNEPLAENVVWAIDHFSAVLKDKMRSDAERADALRFLIHFVGDIHQPLHSVARDTEAFPRGDRGGNDFKISPPPGLNPVPNNLHFLWDMACGLYGSTQRPLSSQGLASVTSLADAIAREFPRESLPELKATEAKAWSLESLAIAKSLAYRTLENAVPSKTYLEAGKVACKRRLALAGFRLADLLNALLY